VGFPSCSILITDALMVNPHEHLSRFNNTSIFPQPFPSLPPPPPSSSSVILFCDPQPLSLPPPLPLLRTLFAGEGDNIHIKRCFVRGDEEEISDLVEGDAPPPPPHDLPCNAMQCHAMHALHRFLFFSCPALSYADLYPTKPHTALIFIIFPITPHPISSNLTPSQPILPLLTLSNPSLPFPSPLTEWRALIAIFLLESKRSVGLSDIGSR
jgi:hypothetical protein